MKIASEDLLAAVALISNVPSRAGVPSSEFIKFSYSNLGVSLELSAEVYGRAFAPVLEHDNPVKEWEAFLDRASFCPFVNVSKELNSAAPFEFIWSAKKKSLVIKCGSRKGVFNEVTNVSGYGDTKNIKGDSISLTDDLKKSLALATKYATPDPTIAYLNCVYVHKGQKRSSALASNERAALRITIDPTEASIPLPLGLLSVIQDSADVKSITVSKTVAKVTTKTGVLCQTINQVSASKFPVKSIHDAINNAKAYPQAFSVLASKLVSALDRLNIYSALVIKRDAIVTLAGKKGSRIITITCKVPQGKFEERVTAKSPVKDDFQMEWLLQLLLPLSTIAKGIGTVSVSFEANKVTPYYLQAKGAGLELLVSRRGK